MSKALERRAKLRQALIEAAERAIAIRGLAGVKSRELAQEIGIANGGVYKLVENLDELVLLVGSRTLARLDTARTAAPRDRAAAPAGVVGRHAVASCGFS